jgi:hypothetical protein
MKALVKQYYHSDLQKIQTLSGSLKSGKLPPNTLIITQPIHNPIRISRIA